MLEQERSILFPWRQIAGKAIGLIILTLLLMHGAATNWRSILKPWMTAAPNILAMSALPDEGRLAALAPAYAQAIDHLRQYPQDTRFYFVPVFQDPNTSNARWWYIYLLARYYIYPRPLLCHDVVLYDNSKTTYQNTFIRGAMTWDQIDWVRERKINDIVTLRNGQLKIQPVTSSVEGL